MFENFNTCYKIIQYADEMRTILYDTKPFLTFFNILYTVSKVPTLFKRKYEGDEFENLENKELYEKLEKKLNVILKDEDKTKNVVYNIKKRNLQYENMTKRRKLNET